MDEGSIDLREYEKEHRDRKQYEIVKAVFDDFASKLLESPPIVDVKIPTPELT